MGVSSGAAGLSLWRDEKTALPAAPRATATMIPLPHQRAATPIEAMLGSSPTRHAARKQLVELAWEGGPEAALDEADDVDDHWDEAIE